MIFFSIDYKQSLPNKLNEQLHYETHTLFSTIAQASHTSISEEKNSQSDVRVYG